MVNLVSHCKRAGVACYLLAATWLLCFSGLAGAQCPVRNSEAATNPGQSDTSQGEPLLPESGLLTNDSYTNLYFGFTFKLPIPLHGHHLMLPIRLPGEHALLAIGFQEGQHYGTLVVTAGGHREEDDKRMTPEQAQQLEDKIARSKGEVVPERRLDYTPPPVHLKRADRHSGEVRGTQYSARIRDYTVRFTVQTNDKSFLEKARNSITTLSIFCADDTGRFFTTDGKSFMPEGTPTTGPTIPTAVVDDSIRSRPAEHTIPAPGFNAGVLQSSGLAFSYALPMGWTVMPTPPDLIADDAKDELDRRLSYLWKACTRTWLQAAGGKGAALTLRVLDQSCLGLPFPASASDTLSAESLGQYLQMLGHFGTIKSNHMIHPGGRLFVVYDGTVAEGQSVDSLAHRDVQTVAVTRYNKLIFAWRWSAPTASALALIPASRATFGDNPPVAVAPSMSTSRTSSPP